MNYRSQPLTISTKYLASVYKSLVYWSLSSFCLANAANPSKPLAQDSQAVQFVQQVESVVNNLLNEKAQALLNDGRGKLSFSIRSLNKNLPFPACGVEPLGEFIQEDWLKPKTHLKISCPGERKSMMVSVDLKLIRPIYVASQAIDRLEPIQNRVKLVERNVLKLNQGFIDDPEALKGLVAKRSIKANSSLHPRLLEKEILVARNSLVAIEANVPGIAITAEGTALDNGAFGETIRVRNNRSKRILNARVVRNALVEVAL